MGILLNIVAQQGQGGNSAVPVLPVSYRQNVVKIPGMPGDLYRAFPFIMQVAPDKLAVIYHRGESVSYEGVMTYAHLYQGNTGQKVLTLSTGEWGPEQIIDTDETRDLSDCYGTSIGGGKFLYSSSRSPVCIKQWAIGKNITDPLDPTYEAPLAGNAEPFIRIANNAADALAGIYGPHRNLYTDPGAVDAPTPQRSCTMYGKPKQGDTENEWFACFLTFGYGIPGDDNVNKGWLIHTTDNWATWTFKLIWANQASSEFDCVYWGNGKLSFFVRIDQSGGVNVYHTGDKGDTVTAGGGIVYDGWTYGVARIIHCILRDGKLDLWLTNRDTGFLQVSYGNEFANIYGVTQPIFNPSSLFCYVRKDLEEKINDGTWDGGGNPVLGYQSVTNLEDGKQAMVVCREKAGDVAELYWSVFTPTQRRVDTAPNAPLAVVGNNRFIQSTEARISVQGYSFAQLQDMDYFVYDLATDAAFTTFPTVRVHAGNAPLTTLNNLRAVSVAVNLYALTPATTYYFRAKAVNGIGESAWTVGTFTTL